MNRTFLEKRNVIPPMAIEELKKNMIDVDEKEAKVILDFLYLIAKLTLRQYFEEDK